MPGQEPSAYDHVPYPGQAFGQSHPDRLATVASVYGMDPAPVPCCRVLELGCGDGSNLIPMAYLWPDSYFLGIDRGARSLETGVGALAELRLRNIELRHLDIMDVAAELGRFDYIIAHGVYSWVPPIVRAKILDIFETNLAPHGVAYLSYNSYPGAYLTDLARGMMLFHVRDAIDPREKIEQSRALLTFLAEASPGNEIYGLVLRAQLERVRAKHDAVLFHDDLDEVASPFFLHQVVEEAARHGLQYLADATSPVVDPRMHPAPVARMLEQIPDRELATREQYLDFINGRGFRQTLLCHGDVELQRNIGPPLVKNYHLAARIDLPSGQVDPLADTMVGFSTAAGTLSTDHRLSKAALLHLGEIWPRTAPFDDLLEHALARLAHATGPITGRRDEDGEALATVLFRAFAARHVSLHLCPPRLTTTISDRPEASRVARQQARKGSVVTNLCHGTVSLEDDLVRRFLPLVDGTRTLDQLVTDLNTALAADSRTGGDRGDDERGRATLTRESVERNLAMLARLGLLVG
jgi:SAM-dependent methyltransferase